MKGFERTTDNIRKEGRQFFVEYDGDNRCIKCCFYYDNKRCKRAKCTKGERSDHKTGYYRVCGSQRKSYRVIDYPQGL